MKEENKPIILEVQSLRGMAILGVIVAHVSSYIFNVAAQDRNTFIVVVGNAFSHYASPLFLIVSGFLMQWNHAGALDVRAFFLRRFRSVFPPYLIFTILYTWLLANSQHTPFTITQILRNLVLASSSYHMWFMLVIIQLYLLYPLLRWLYSVCKQRGQVALFIAGAWMAQIAWILGGSFEITQNPQNCFLIAVLFFVLGMVLADHFDQVTEMIEKIPLPILLSIALTSLIAMSWPLLNWSFFSERHFPRPFLIDAGYRYLLPFFAPTMGALGWRVIRTRSAWLRWLRWLLAEVGFFSFGIYLVHPAVLKWVAAWLFAQGWGPGKFRFFPMAYVLTLLLTYGVVRLLNLLPISRYLIGVHRDWPVWFANRILVNRES